MRRNIRRAKLPQSDEIGPTPWRLRREHGRDGVGKSRVGDPGTQNPDDRFRYLPAAQQRIGALHRGDKQSQPPSPNSAISQSCVFVSRQPSLRKA